MAMDEKATPVKSPGFLQESNGTFSSIRLLSVLWGAGIFAVWAVLSIQNRSAQNIPVEILAFGSSVILYKVGQKFGEKPPVG